tara:strand:- start:523 stop:855 length:333 start_codon:yes stop_codon:yes gene_type:complete
MDDSLTRRPTSLKQALVQLDLWKEAYKGLAANAFIAVLMYEQYLLDNIDSKELAKVMRDLYDALPEDSFTEALEALKSDVEASDDSGVKKPRKRRKKRRKGTEEEPPSHP